jgi:hypothetical protein
MTAIIARLRLILEGIVALLAVPSHGRLVVSVTRVPARVLHCLWTAWEVSNGRVNVR